MEVIQESYFGPDDFLDIVVVNPIGFLQYQINLVLDTERGIEMMNYLFVPVAAPGNRWRMSLTGYKLLALSVNLLAGGTFPYLPQVGLFLTRGQTIGVYPNINLISGYPRYHQWPFLAPISA